MDSRCKTLGEPQFGYLQGFSRTIFHAESVQLCAMAGVDKFALCKLMGQSSPTVTEKYYIHVTTEHVAAVFEKFVQYSERATAEGIAAAFPQATEAVQ